MRGKWPDKQKQKCPLCMGDGKAYNGCLCPGCNGEGLLPWKLDEDIDGPSLKGATQSVSCDQYERLSMSWDAHREAMSYFLSHQGKPGVSDERAACLAREEQDTMERLKCAISLHRQICRTCMAEDDSRLRQSRGY
jgi:hypothetical protein